MSERSGLSKSPSDVTALSFIGEERSLADTWTTQASQSQLSRKWPVSDYAPYQRPPSEYLEPKAPETEAKTKSVVEQQQSDYLPSIQTGSQQSLVIQTAARQSSDRSKDEMSTAASVPSAQTGRGSASSLASAIGKPKAARSRSLVGTGKEKDRSTRSRSSNTAPNDSHFTAVPHSGQKSQVDAATKTGRSTTHLDTAAVRTLPNSTAKPIVRPPRQLFDPHVTGRSLLMMRNAESLERIFPGWTHLAFVQGSYRPYDLNQPQIVPTRPGGQQDFENDSPITEMGHMAAQMLGRALRLGGQVPSAIYSSPALRCVQTASSVLKALALDTNAQIRIEPALYDWMAWNERPPNWMSPQQLRQAGYAIDCNYNPAITIEQLLLAKKENSVNFSRRTFKAIESILKRHPERGNVLVVSHATNMEAAVRPLLGHGTEQETRQQMERRAQHYPAGCCLCVQEEKTGRWRLNAQPPPITYLDSSTRLNYKQLQRNATDPNAEHFYTPQWQFSDYSHHTGLQPTAATGQPLTITSLIQTNASQITQPSTS